MTAVVLGNSVRYLRTQRLSRPRDGRYLLVPLDHSLSDGALCSAAEFADLVAAVSGSGADAVVVHKGRARYLPMDSLIDCSVIIHLSGSTAHAPDPDRKTLVCGVEEALACGADAVSVHINMGARSEADQLADLAAVARECELSGAPLLAMMYARGPNVPDPADPRRIRHAVTVATELGADLIKCNVPFPAEELESVTKETPVPVLVAGGQRTPGTDDLLEFARDAIDRGAAGVAVGRRIFQDPDPAKIVVGLREVIHHLEIQGEHQ